MSMAPANASLAALARQALDVLGWIVCMGMTAALGYVVINGPEMRAAGERQKTEAIARENGVFCQKFGAGPETSLYAACADALMQVRRKHEERIYQDEII
jgi:hypothetical protein